GGLEKTAATATALPATGQPFPNFVRVTMTKSAPNGNDTQAIVPIPAAISKGDTLRVTMYVRGKKPGGAAAEANLYIIKNAPPWTNNGTTRLQAVPGKPTEWRRVSLAFTAVDDYAAGETAVCVHLAYGAQTFDIGGLTVTNYGGTATEQDILERDAIEAPTRTVTIAVDRKVVRQTMTGFGGNFVSFGYGTASDPVDKYITKNLRVDHARVGIVLRDFLKDDGTLDRSKPLLGGVFDLMKQMQTRKTPLVASVWNLPNSYVQNPDAENQRRIKPEKRDAVISTLTQWLTIARDEYGVTVPYVSFNEADGGYSILLPPDDARYFVINGGKAFAKAGLKTKWLLGDTANGGGFPAYANAILSDPATLPYLGAASFHGWDSLSASDDSYRAIATLAKKHNKPVWCLEAGYDAQLWQKQPSPFGTWDNALKIAQSYARCITLAEASVIDYWQYRGDYPLVGGKDATEPFPAYRVIEMYTKAFAPGTKIVTTMGGADGVYTVAGLAPTTGKLCVLIVNTGGAAKVTLTGGSPGAKYAASNRARNRVATPSAITDKAGRTALYLTPRSVTMLTEQ
ncbi:MAG: hypothetical protein H7Y38_07315, partial [Armatimonadetes bacterium]|nr:hypothetical protein [Armatimonadota bacterium]